MIEVVPNWHPMLVHFTVGLFAAAWLFYLLAALAGSRPGLIQQWRIAARWTLWLGAVFTIGTVLAGWNAYNTVEHDATSHAAMTVHRNWGFVTAGLFLILALWVGFRVRSARPEGLSLLLALTVAVVLLTTTAWRGGELVYRYGLGVMSLPDTGEHDHAAHDHDGAAHDTGDHHDAASSAPAVPDGTPAGDSTEAPEAMLPAPAESDHDDDGHEHHDHAH